MKISCSIIFYNPILSEVTLNIKSFINFIDILYVFDNSDNDVYYQKELENRFPKIKYFTFHENRGVAFALNYCANIAYENGYEWLLTMDQDSSFSFPDGFNNYLHSVKKEMNKRTAFFSPLFPGEMPNAKQFYTSGALMKLYAWNKIGKFDENLFIDEVDGDFTYRLIEANYTLVKIKNVLLNHKLGNPCSKIILGKTFYSDNHSALRKYYIARNRIYLMKKHPQMRFPYFKDSFYKFVLFLLVESNKKGKLLMILKGIYDGLIGKMSKYKNA